MSVKELIKEFRNENNLTASSFRIDSLADEQYSIKVDDLTEDGYGMLKQHLESKGYDCNLTFTVKGGIRLRCKKVVDFLSPGDYNNESLHNGGNDMSEEVQTASEIEQETIPVEPVTSVPLDILPEKVQKAKPVYKKTDRIRNVKKHEVLDIVREGLEKNLADVLGRSVEVNVTRSQERRYARALFKVVIDDVIIDGKTVEEIMSFAESVRVMQELRSAA